MSETWLKALEEGGGSLKALIKEKLYIEEEVPPLGKGSYVRSSSFPTICPREETICSIRNIVRKSEVKPDLMLIFQHGHGLHDRLQNHILPTIGVLRGIWECKACRHFHGGVVDEWTSPENWAVPMPERCEQCGENDGFEFHEEDLVDHEHRITGHCDGFLEIPGLEGLGILEAKSIGTSWEIQNVPKLDHVIQIQLYLWMTGLKWGFILYWVKNEAGLNGLVEHYIERDEDTIAQIKKELKAIWNGVDSGVLPDRICTSADCPRAKECAVSSICFEEYP